jgi:hypothetical protein
MATPEHIRQQQYRERRAAKLARAEAIEDALIRIRAELDGNTKPLAVKLRAIADEALSERKAPA